MFDPKFLRTQADEIEAKLKTRDHSLSLSSLKALDEEVRTLIEKEQELQATRNRLSKEIGLQKSDPKKAAELSKEVQKINKLLEEISEKRKEKEVKFTHELAFMPNIPDASIPVSLDPKDNQCIKTFGKKREFSFPFKNHLELGASLGLFDFERATKMSGSNWPCYTALGARLEWALLNYMLDIHHKNGFTFLLPPILVKEEIVYGSGQLPKFSEQLYKVKDEDYLLYLIPTAEVSICGFHHDEILEEKSLPLKYTSYTPCFRREAGAAGKQERGLIRMHQFNKVELFAFTTPETSMQVFEEILSSAEEILQGLHLHYRNMLLCTGDLSFASTKTVDIEVYLPGQNRYYEVSSVSNCLDFQARRSKIRCKSGSEKPRLVHTLNGSGLATSRLMVALLENNQNEDGSVTIPQVLHRYLEEEITVLKPKGNR